MKGKVNCTCGWSWNKSDSSKKDMYICHECGRDNSNNMKNGGWLDNYNDSQASAPEGMEGDGFSNVGRNYSPAWGGQFQMGGSVYPVNYVPEAQMGASIPGAVGFSYARTQGAAPSNGKYAKKTMASAQNGQEMQYYREGLDFQPKTISKNGGWLDGYDKAQNGVQKNALSILDDVYKRKQQGQYKNVKVKDERKQVINSPESTSVKRKDFDAEQSKSNKAYYNAVAAQKKEDVRRKGLTQDQREREDYDVRNEQTGTIQEYVPESTWDRTKAIASNPLTAFGYAARNESLPENFSRGERNTLDMATDIINPAFYLNQGYEAGENIGSSVSNVAQGNYPAAYRDIKNAGMNALMTLPLAAEYKTIGKGVGKLGRALGTDEGLINNLSKSRTLNEVKGSLVGIPPEKALPRLSAEELKIYRQVQDIGRMRATGKPISEQYKYALEQGIPEEHLQQIFNKSKSEIESIIPNAQEQEAFRIANPIRDRINLERPPRRTSTSDQMIDVMNSSPEQLSDFASQVGMTEDELVNFARSSMSQQTRSDVIRHTLSDYDIDRVTNQLNPIPEEFILNTGSTRGRTLISGQRPEMTLGESFNAKNADVQRDIYNTIQSTKNKIVAGSQNYPYYEGPVLENVPSLSLSGSGSLKNVSNKVAGQSSSGINSGDVFTGSLNTSHSSYLPQLKQVFKYGEGSPQFLGYKPMNHMGFLSDYRYPSKDIAKYLNTEIDIQIGRGIIPKDIQRPYTKGDNVLLPHYGIKQFEEGGIIKDDRGQWEHPGEITEIGSNQITMQGVPYPVLGISDEGDTKLMKPGKDYKFKGKKVTEFPMAKNGLRQEQKGLVNLDNLLNFTNYNKPQSGGWLDTL